MKKAPEVKTKTAETFMPKWILPPGLQKPFEMFIELYETVFKKPRSRKLLLIHGDPGVGKSLFTYAFERLYRRDRSHINDDDVKRVNVSALSENLVESELFGHIRGAFSGALRDKMGLVETAKLLILEEIGELPKYVQAKLLTIIEDGIYYRVGSEKARYAKDIQIIATTNVELNEKNVRKDFLDRCYTFYVPAIHARRDDIIYILAHDYFELARQLLPSQVLAVMAYNWPGNMREIEKFGVMRGKTLYCNSDFYISPSLNELRSILYKMGIESSVVSSVLRKGRLSFNDSHRDERDDFDSRPALSDIKRLQLQQYDNAFPEIGVIEKTEILEQVIEGVMTLSHLLYVDYQADINLIDTTKVYKTPKYVMAHNGFFYPRLGGFPLVRVAGKKAEAVWNDCMRRSADYLREKLYGTPKKSELNPLVLSEENLLKTYYKTLLLRTEGNIAKAARLAGMNDRTFRSRLKKYDIK